MAQNFDFFRKQAITLGITDPLQIKVFIREEQIQMENEIKEKEMATRLTLESERIKGELLLAEQRLEIEKQERDKRLQMEELERQKKFEIEQEKLQLEKTERERKLKLEDKKIEKLRIEAEKAAEEAKRLTIQSQLDNEFRHAESQKAFEIQKLETEAKNRYQHEVSARGSETQIRLAEISASVSNTNLSVNSQNNSVLSCKQIRDLPPLKSLDRDQIDIYLSHFKRLCVLNKIPEQQYCLYIALKLPTELIQILTRMLIEDGQNYALFRKNICKFLLDGDYFRNKFYSLNLKPGDSNAEFVRKLSEISDKWLQAEQVTKDYENLFSFFITQYFRKLPIDKSIFSKEHHLSDLSQITQVADVYDIAHLRDPKRKVNNFNSFGNHNNNTTANGNVNPQIFDKSGCSNCGKKNHTADTFFSKKTQNVDKGEMICTHCKKKGHVVDTCYALHGKPSIRGNLRQAHSRHQHLKANILHIK